MLKKENAISAQIQCAILTDSSTATAPSAGCASQSIFAPLEIASIKKSSTAPTLSARSQST